MTTKLTVREFFERFPDDEACLNHIMDVRFGLRHVCRKCGVESTFHRLANGRAHSLAPIVATMSIRLPGRFFRTRGRRSNSGSMRSISLSRRATACPARNCSAQLGVTYKTAWRMGMKIREADRQG